MGLAGAAQVLRLERIVDELRRGQVVKHREEVVYALSSLWPQEASPGQLLDLARSHWVIENGQHYRRDRTQLEDRCPVRETNTAWVLSLFRSLTIFLFVAQRGLPTGQDSLPDYERKNHRNPSALIRRFMRPPT
jgi:hypothetical protein